MFQIEAAMQFANKGSWDDGNQSLVKRLFYGKKRQKIQPIVETGEPAPISVKEDIFAQLLVNVSEEGFDLYDGLSGFLDDTIEFEGRKAKMEVTLLELPPVLQIQLQRVQFDRETMQQFKSNAYVKFGESLFVDRFLESANPEKRAKSREIQSQLRICQDRILALTRGQKGISYPDALNKTIDFLQNQELLPLADWNVDFSAQLTSEKAHLDEELRLLREAATALKTQLEDLWRDEQSAQYELSSVFIHRGTSPSWGHYFFYSRHLPDSPDSWYKYNDSDVSLVSKEEVLADGTGSTANPYLLVYVRKSSNVIQTVHRQPVESS
jgi:ubiquitin carboxyl-terminal hydrolase 25/28